MIDGIKPFVTGLASGQRVLSAEAVHEFTERIANPRLPKKDAAPISHAAWEEEDTQPPPSQRVSRARAIFDASEEAKPFNPADFDFAMVDEVPTPDTLSSSQPDSTTLEPRSTSTTRHRRILGMTPGQWVFIAVLGIALLAIAAVFAYLLLTQFLP
jgi:hypothetical protein